ESRSVDWCSLRSGATAYPLDRLSDSGPQQQCRWQPALLYEKQHTVKRVRRRSAGARKPARAATSADAGGGLRPALRLDTRWWSTPIGFRSRRTASDLQTKHRQRYARATHLRPGLSVRPPYLAGRSMVALFLERRKARAFKNPANEDAAGWWQ